MIFSIKFTDFEAGKLEVTAFPDWFAVGGDVVFAAGSKDSAERTIEALAMERWATPDHREVLDLHITWDLSRVVAPR